MLGQEPDMREQQRRQYRSLASDTPGHPARGRYFIAAGLLAHGSMLLSGLPEAFASVASMDEAHRLQLRGQLRNCRTVQGLAHRIPSWLRTTDPQNRDADVMGSGVLWVKGKASHCGGMKLRPTPSGQREKENRSGHSEATDPLCHDRNAHREKIVVTISLRISRSRDFYPAIPSHRA
jgi:hypothetical protein